MQCPHCGKELPKEVRFCNGCGKPMVSADNNKEDDKIVFCIHCGKELPKGAQFCPACGKRQIAAGKNARVSLDARELLNKVKSAPRSMVCYGLQAFALLVYSVFPIISDGNTSVGLIFNSGYRSGSFVMAKFIGFVFIALFISLLVRGYKKPEKLVSSVILELVLAVVFGFISLAFFSGQNVEWYHSSSFNWLYWDRDDLALSWGFYATIITLIAALVSARITQGKNHK